jgi:hypothetical protein
LAAVAAAAAFVAGVTGWIKTQWNDGNVQRSGMLGRGPHRKAQCKPSGPFVEQLMRVIQELQEWISESGVQVDQKSLDAILAMGSRALATKNYQSAISHYCHVLTQLMREVRVKSEAKDSDSIDY